MSYKFLSLLPVCIGLFCGSLRAAVEEPDPQKLAEDHMVFVEPDYVSKVKVDDVYGLVPYLERRPRWGKIFSLGYCNYEPVNLETNFTQYLYGDVYGPPSVPLLELEFAIKRNWDFGSLGGELSFGGFDNSNSDPEYVSSTLTVIPVRVGAIFSFDTVMTNGLIAPYFAGGVYTMIYKESLGDNSLKGNTLIAPYFIGGVAMGLDWLDRKASRIAFQDSGIQRSYVYLDIRKYFASASPKDPDFSSDLNWGAGIRVEF